MTTSWTYILHWHTHVSDNVPTKRVKRDTFVRLPPLPRVDTPIHLTNIPQKKHLLRRNEKPKKIQHIPSVAVAVPTHNRIGYVQLASKAISGTFPSKDVWLFDDKSTEYTPKELMRWYETKHIFSPEKQLKADAMARHILEWFVDTDYDVLVLLDSDLIVAPNWLDSLHAGLRDSTGVLSLYRSGAPKHKSSSCGAVLCEQPSMGNAGTVWRRELAEKMLSEMSNREGGFDWGWSEWCEKNKVPMQALKASAVLHIGMHGSWSHETTQEKSLGFPMQTLSADVRHRAEHFLKGAKPVPLNPSEFIHEQLEMTKKRPAIHKNIAFLHIGKAGGTSVDSSIGPVIRKLGYHYIGGRHFDWSYVDTLKDASVITMLREPVSRAVSHFHFAKTLGWTRGLPMRHQTLTEYFKDPQGLLDSRGVWQDGQAMVSWLSGTHIANWVGIKAAEVSARENKWQDIESVCRLAAKRLRATIWFGILDDIERSMELLKFVIDAPEDISLGKSNSHHHTKASESEEKVLESLMPADIWLFKYARLLFEARWNAYKTGVFKEPEEPPFPKIWPCESTRFSLDCIEGPLKGLHWKDPNAPAEHVKSYTNVKQHELQTKNEYVSYIIPESEPSIMFDDVEADWTMTKCTPVYFLGGGKAGSTTLAMLLKHKGPSYKTHDYEGQFAESGKEVCWAEKSSVSPQQYWSKFHGCDQPKFALDACPRYYRESHVKNIARVHPNARFIMLLREPIDRMVSHINFQQSRYGVQGDFDKRFENLPSSSDKVWELSQYAKMLKIFLKYFSSKQIILVKTDNLKHHATEVISAIMKHIGGTPFVVSNIISNQLKSKKGYKTPSSEMANKVRTEMSATYAWLEDHTEPPITWKVDKENAPLGTLSTTFSSIKDIVMKSTKVDYALLWVIPAFKRAWSLDIVLQSLSGREATNILVSKDADSADIDSVLKKYTAEVINHPWSCSKHPNQFPAKDDTLNENYKGDTYGNPRSPWATCLKHHWWWMMKHAWARNPERVCVLEDDTVIHPQAFEWLARQTGNVKLTPDEIAVPWCMSAKEWQAIDPKAFCEHDDYNWDQTIAWMKEHGHGPNKAVVPSASLSMHVGDCGGWDAGNRNKKCTSEQIDTIHRNVKKWLSTPLSIHTQERKWLTAHAKPNGGWGHPRDWSHCMSSNSKSVVDDTFVPSVVENKIVYCILFTMQRFNYALAKHDFLRLSGVPTDDILMFMGAPKQPHETRDLTEYNIHIIDKKSDLTTVYKWMLHIALRSNKYAVIIEDDLQLGVDFIDYFKWGQRVMEKDPSVFSVSAWHDNSHITVKPNKNVFLRTEQFMGLGWLTSARWLPLLETALTDCSPWDVCIYKEMKSNKLSSVFPQFSRVYHMPWKVSGNDLHITQQIQPSRNTVFPDIDQFLNYESYLCSLGAHIHSLTESEITRYINPKQIFIKSYVSHDIYGLYDGISVFVDSNGQQHIFTNKKLCTTPDNYVIDDDTKQIENMSRDNYIKCETTRFSIRGERHSGTGWLRQLLQRNIKNSQYKLDNNLDMEAKYGWKHAEIDPNLDTGCDVILFIFRDYKTWIPRMRLNTYERTPPSNVEMQDFLRSEWKNENKPYWKNIFEMRTSKYKNWLSYNEKHSRTEHIRYEDLIVDGGEKFITQLCEKYKISCKVPFSRINHKVKHNQISNLVQGNDTYTWTPDVIDIVNNHIDVALEEKLGYWSGARHSEHVQTADLFAVIDYNAPENSGPWKQGWDYDYDGRFKDGLTVHVVPHSHNDPGWIQTYHTYYSTQTKHILDTVVAALTEDPRRTFIWAEISYFSLWWDDATQQQKEQAKKLVAEKRLDFVTGGWVMNDEASVTARATRWHLQEGREWLKETFGVTPQYSWAIDPFGHSAGQAQVLKELGYKGMLIQRVHYAVKKQLAQKQQLEFQWQTPAGEIFTHMMPFYSYDGPHTCGPDPSVCCQFDFARIGKGKTWTGCPWGKMAVEITEHNVAERSRKWLDQVYKKAMLYRGKHVLVPVGDDFRYQTMEEAHKQYRNYQKMFDWIETNVPAVKVSFSTLTRYFDAAVQTNVPKLQGSFFPYSDREKDYWTGYFNSRIFYKGYDRLLESLIAAVERKCPSESIHSEKRTLGLFQHHDGITGTAKSHVVQDYYQTMQKAVESLRAKLKGCLSITESVFMNPLSIDTPTMKADEIRPILEDTCVSGAVPFEHIKIDEHGRLIQIDGTPVHELLVWRSNKPGSGVAGAYLMAVTSTKDILQPTKHTTCVTKKYKQIETTFDMLKRRIRVYKDGTIEFIYDVDIHTRNNGELWAVYKPEWTAETLCSDVHGLTWECHVERKDAPLQAKFWPMPTMSWTSSSSQRMTWTGAQPTGVGFHDGALVLMLDRRGDQDDARGLGQGITDSRPVEMRFVVLMENMTKSNVPSEKALKHRKWVLNPGITIE